MLRTKGKAATLPPQQFKQQSNPKGNKSLRIKTNCSASMSNQAQKSSNLFKELWKTIIVHAAWPQSQTVIHSSQWPISRITAAQPLTHQRLPLSCVTLSRPPSLTLQQTVLSQAPSSLGSGHYGGGVVSAFPRTSCSRCEVNNCERQEGSKTTSATLFALFPRRGRLPSLCSFTSFFLFHTLVFSCIFFFCFMVVTDLFSVLSYELRDTSLGLCRGSTKKATFTLIQLVSQRLCPFCINAKHELLQGKQKENHKNIILWQHWGSLKPFRLKGNRSSCSGARDTELVTVSQCETSLIH